MLSGLKKSVKGRRILKFRPLSTEMSEREFEGLKGMGGGTFGREYYEFMKRYGFEWRERPKVRFIDDLEVKYVFER